MSVYVSNSLYLSPAGDTYNRPIIGWHNVLTLSDIAATSELESRPAINLWNQDTSSVWESAITDEQYITLTNSGGGNVDYIGIAKHNFGTGRISYQIQSSMDGDTWTDVTILRSPADNKAILHYFEPSSDTYFRVRLVPTETTAPVAAHIKLGAALLLQRRIYVGHKPATLTRHSSVITNGSENGQYLGKIVTRQWHQTDVKQENVTPEFVRTYVEPFIDHVHTGTFFFAWRPIDYPQEVVYGWTDDNIAPSNQRPNGMMEFSFNIQAVV